VRWAMTSEKGGKAPLGPDLGTACALHDMTASPSMGTTSTSTLESLQRGAALDSVVRQPFLRGEIQAGAMRAVVLVNYHSDTTCKQPTDIAELPCRAVLTSTARPLLRVQQRSCFAVGSCQMSREESKHAEGSPSPHLVRFMLTVQASLCRSGAGAAQRLSRLFD
jgi:hypothetical protein